MSRANEQQIGGNHYRCKYQHWDFVMEHGLNYLQGCATKYVARWRKKNGVQDLEKALHYTQKLAETKSEQYGQKVVQRNLDLFGQFNDLAAEEVLIIDLISNYKTIKDLDKAQDLIRLLIENQLAAAHHIDITGQKHPFGFDAKIDS